MKQRFCTLLLALSFGLAVQFPASAAGKGSPDIIVNDEAIHVDEAVFAEKGVTYVPFWNVIKALYPTASMEKDGEEITVNAPHLTLNVKIGRKYLIANERCLYLPHGPKVSKEGEVLLPSRMLGVIVGADVSWDPVGCDVVFTAGAEPIADGSSVYNADDLYWLSRIIYAESGNQPLEGKIAVGNVVLNRTASSTFPDSVKEVIFQKNQFSPVGSGSIHRTPNEESVVAAKLCLDGANTIGNALFFFNPRLSGNCWAARNRTYVATIGEHAFYA